MGIAEEKEKIYYEHRLALRRIIIEKCGFAILLLILAGIGTYTIESYKISQQKERFFLEKQLEAYSLVNQKLSKTKNYFYQLSEKSYDIHKDRAKKSDITEEDVGIYISFLKETVKEIYNSSAYFDSNFQSDILMILSLMKSVGERKIEDLFKYRLFVKDLAIFLDYKYKNNMGMKTIKPIFIPDILPSETVEEMKLTKYLEQNYKKWNECCVKKDKS